MPTASSTVTANGRNYTEREIIAIFSDELSLNSAVDDLIAAGVDREDLSVLARSDRLTNFSAERLEDDAGLARTAYEPSDARTEGLAAMVAVPALLGGLGGAWVVGAIGVALVPSVFSGAAALGAVGLLLARMFGLEHAAYIQDQISSGGLLLWVRAPEPAKDKDRLAILAARGARDAHVHLITRHWGTDDVPLHDFNVDPLIER
ncbi:MAG: hypothetical protein J0I45_00370 [Bosea sp.]|nr:hypothetical protein [Bosea sp. (in: a-proteobacteria)]